MRSSTYLFPLRIDPLSTGECCNEPHHGGEELHRDEDGGDDRGYVGRPPRGLRGRVEYPRDPVCLGQEGAVHGAESHSHAEALEGTHHDAGLRQEDEGIQVAHEEAAEDHVAQLAAGRPRQRCVGELNEDADRDHGENDPYEGDANGHDGERRVPSHVLKR